jgi:hypothetical protein
MNTVATPVPLPAASRGNTNQLDLSLAHQGLFTVPDASGVQVICREGSLWITLDNDPRDIVLAPGESFITTEHRRALIYAMGASALTLAASPCTEGRSRVNRVSRQSRDGDSSSPFALQPACS